MPDCPTCGAHIETLLEDMVISTEVRLDASQSLQYVDKRSEQSIHGYACPTCGDRLFEEKTEAVAFLVA
jgi:DNA-directed RNA polymerase subunit RPC12/RpoP